MAEQVAGFPFWLVTFDEQGHLTDPAQIRTVGDELAALGTTELFIFSHGWNNSLSMARDLYERFFGQVRQVLDRSATSGQPAPAIGAMGVIWPSMRWADEPSAVPRSGGAASARSSRSDGDLVRALMAIYHDAAQQAALEELGQLLDERPEEPAKLRRFHTLMSRLTATPDVAQAGEDNGERALLDDSPEKAFARMAAVAPRRRRAAAGVGNPFERLWDGAKEALRAATYWEMKKRAGVIGQGGLGPRIGELQQARADLRIHLLGHSFGARLVSFALAGLPGGASGPASPVKSLFLLQGAFSHFAFASALPHAPERGGALAGMKGRVDGPLLVSHTLLDTAVGRAYPLASLAAREDAAGANDLLFRWGAMGHDGAQAVDATEQAFGPIGQDYPFAKGAFINLDGNALIKDGGPPAGAHGDIFHPEIAWASLAAAGLVGGS